MLSGSIPPSRDVRERVMEEGEGREEDYFIATWNVYSHVDTFFLFFMLLMH